MSNGTIVTRTNIVCDWCPEDQSALFEWFGEALCQPCFEEAESDWEGGW